MEKPGAHKLAEIRHVDGGLQITIRGDWVGKVDVAMVEGCVSALAQCASANRCLDNRIAVTDSCVRALVGHDLQARCIEGSFGFAPKERAGTHA